MVVYTAGVSGHEQVGSVNGSRHVSPGVTELGSLAHPRLFLRSLNRSALQLHSRFSPVLWPTGTPVSATSIHRSPFLPFLLSPLLGYYSLLCQTATGAFAARQLHDLRKGRLA